VMGDSKAYSAVLIAASGSAAWWTRAASTWSTPSRQDLKETRLEVCLFIAKDPWWAQDLSCQGCVAVVMSLWGSGGLKDRTQIGS
jgi:hypothetical protein